MNGSRSLLLFYFLVGYVVIQFIWWSFLLIRQNSELYELKRSMNLLQHEDPQLIIEKGNELEKKLHTRMLMIAGEGLIFMALLTIGFIRVRSSIQREASLSRQQTNFMHSITHELKSPIASVKLALETLKKYDLDKDRRQDVVDNALSDAERLNRLVDNILLSARIENKSHLLTKEPTDLSRLTGDLLGKLLALHNSHNLIPAIPPSISASIDRDAYSSILINLVENAMKYSPIGSVIRVILGSNGNNVTLSIIDEGSGIPDSEKTKIFEKFYRLGQEETRKTKGTGLGLFIVNYLVKEMKGNIQVKDNKPRGTQFIVSFYV